MESARTGGAILDAVCTAIAVLSPKQFWGFIKTIDDTGIEIIHGANQDKKYEASDYSDKTLGGFKLLNREYNHESS
ncbi:MAG TPA: hypothetical protein VMV35_04110 [Halothiobacillus sp.]|nr:hypothetical protein [Halothiobacillus sp.]